jgi:hypothetical protein
MGGDIDIRCTLAATEDMTMSRTLALSSLMGAIALVGPLNLALIAPATAQVSISAGIVLTAPPPPRVEVHVAPPMPGYVWIDGYWNWEGGRHIWVPGRWAAPRTGYRWEPHSWVREGQGWRLHAGHWRRDHEPHHQGHQEEPHG